ncbi:MAG: hypothetical protein ACTHJW_20210 [Streptosporangiaceae bacterium]
MAAGRRTILAGLALLSGAALVGCTAGSERTPHGGSTTISTGSVVIAQGWIAGTAWRITVDPSAGRLCAGEAGLPHACANLRGLERGNAPATLSGAEVPVHLGHPYGSSGVPIWNALFGTVRTDVTMIVMRMQDGREVRLRPVAAAGTRWVGLVLQPGAPDVARTIAYAGRTELAYSVPFYGGALRAGTYFVTWLRPDQQGPARASRYIATGGSGDHDWDALVLAGPWGYCASLGTPGINGNRQDCWSRAVLRSHAGVLMRIGSPAAIPRWIIGTASSSVAYLRLFQAGHVTARVPVTIVSGQRFYATRIDDRIVRWGAYSAAGRKLYGGNGPPDEA